MCGRSPLNILDLPSVVLMEIFEYLSYDEVSKKRLVCRRFDHICQQVLNGGFNKVIKQHSINFKRIKALLPRRESERRNHCLARHADILTSIETRISMLSMTYSKYMDLNLCCFIPGKVLDEIFRILRLIGKSNKPLRPHEVLQELRDISSMAIEHFDEKIVHQLKKTFADNSGGGSKMCCPEIRRSTPSNTGLGSTLKTAAGNSGGNHADQQSPSTSSAYFGGGEHQHIVAHPPGDCPEARSALMYCKKLEGDYKKGVVKMHRMQQIQNLQYKRLQQALSSVAELNVQIVELKKRLEDVDAKNREISANIRHINGGASPETAKTTPPLCTDAAVTIGPTTDETATASNPPLSTEIATPSATSAQTQSNEEIENKAMKRRCNSDGVDIGVTGTSSLEEFAEDNVADDRQCSVSCISVKKVKLEQ
ncbi:F-box only protein 28 isoform X3 [Musca domestica]|uniref:F-box only protein 28 isoform X3 n=1 Tax=Musca domestica TaxID=7370 RepID=A0A1I8MVS7_MUSDO|nr:F-box only protein 28 isoform X3 [Musca domestica]